MYTQAQKVIGKFGGVPRVATALDCDPSGIYKWTYTKEEGGTDGLIPSSALPRVLKAAEILGIELTKEDLDPR